MWEIILCFIVSFMLTYLVIPVVIRVADRKGLYSIQNKRKMHMALKPSLGGLCIFAGFMFTCLFLINLSSYPEFQYFFAATFVIFFLGLKDDILVIAPLKKFLGQVLVTVFIVNLGGLQIRNLQGFMGIYEMPSVASIISSYLIIIIIINSYNLIDGVDGLAASLSLMSTLLLGGYFFFINLAPYGILSLSLAGSLSAFLLFNFQPAKIFMGDTGYLLIGLISSILVIKFVNVSQGNPRLPMHAAPAVAFSLLAVPLLNALRLLGKSAILFRLRHVYNKNHIHQLLLDFGFTHKKVTVYLLIVNIVFVLLSYVEQDVGNNWLIFSMLISFFLSIRWLNYFIHSKSSEKIQDEMEKERETSEVTILELREKSVLERQ